MYACRLYSDRRTIAAAGAYAVSVRPVGKDGVHLHHRYLHCRNVSCGTACRKTDGREEISVGARNGLSVFSDFDGSFADCKQRDGRRGGKSGHGIHAMWRKRYVGRHDKLKKMLFMPNNIWYTISSYEFRNDLSCELGIEI